MEHNKHIKKKEIVMKVVKVSELNKNYNVVENVEKVLVLESGKVDTRKVRKAKYNAVVNKKGTKVEKLTTERGTIVFDVENGVFVSGFYSVNDYSAAKTEAKRLAGENKRPFVLLQVYLACEARRVKGTAEYIPQEDEAVYSEAYVVAKTKAEKNTENTEVEEDTTEA